MSNLRYYTTHAEYTSEGKLLVRVRRPWSGQWARLESEDNTGDKDGSSTDQKDMSSDKELVELRAQLAKRDSELAAITPRLQELEKLERARETDRQQKEDDARLKKEGADKLLKEKSQELQDALSTIEQLEERERTRVQALFATLSEDVRESIKEFEEKLQLADWVILVEKHTKLNGGGRSDDGGDSDEDRKTNRFVGGGGGDKEGDKVGYKTSARAQEILDEIGKGEQMSSRLHTVFSTDDNEQGIVKFTLPVRQFFKDMTRERVFSVVPQREDEGS